MLTRRTTEGLSRAAACVTRTNIQNWFERIKAGLAEDGLDEILLDPSRLYSCDEIGFILQNGSRQVYAPIGSKNVHQLAENKEQISALFCFSADGEVLDPFVIFSGKICSARLKAAIPPGVQFCLTANGWETPDSFLYWIRYLIRYLRSKKVKLPVILFVDGHYSHESLEV